MNNQEIQERRNERIGAVTSIGIHCLLAICLFFLLAWDNADPLMDGDGGTGKGGVVLNFGIDPAGYGDLQNTGPVGDSENEDPAPGEPAPSETEIIEAPVVEEIPESAEGDIITGSEESAYQLEAKKEEPKKVTEKKEFTEVKEPKKEPKKDPVPTSQALFPDKVGAGGTSGTGQSGSNNNGDRKGAVGDQGDPNGSLNSNALYGTPGDGGPGPKLELTGWNLAFRPEKDKTNENGKIVFNIEVDSEGELTRITVLEKTVSPSLVKYYQDEIERKWSVERTRDNVKPPPRASGTYTIIVRSR
jgi:protein TonB